MKSSLVFGDLVGFLPVVVTVQLLLHFVVVIGWQLLHHPLKSSWRWLGGRGLTLSRSSHSSTPRRTTHSAAPYTYLGSPPYSGLKVGGPS